MTQKTRKTMKIDLGRVLLWSAVLVEAPRFAGAMLAADVNHIEPWLSYALNLLNVVSGVFMGVIIVAATAFLLDAVRRERPTITLRRKAGNVDKANWRFWGMVGFAAGLLVIEPLILAPYIVSRMTGETVAAVLASPGWRYAWAVLVVVAPALVVGGVSFAQPGLVGVGESASQRISQSASQGAEGDAGDTPGRRKQAGGSPEGSPGGVPVYRSFAEVPSGEWGWIAGAASGEIVGRYRLAGRDPARTARNWRQYAVEKMNGHESASQ